MTARETLRLTASFFFSGPKAAIEERIQETLVLTGLEDRADRSMKGFSGGERQRSSSATGMGFLPITGTETNVRTSVLGGKPMPDGKTHSVMALAASGVLAYIMQRQGLPLEDTLITVKGCLVGLVIGPDLDVDNGFIGFAAIEKFLGRPVAVLWRAFWWPYAKIMEHRSFLSHFPVISSLIRLAYVYDLYILASRLFGFPIWVPDLHTFAYIVFGLLVSDTLHYAADVMWTRLKRSRNAILYFPMSEMRTIRRGYSQLLRTAPGKASRLRRSTGV